MSSTAPLADLSLRDFSDRLAQRTPTPGGGCMAAYLVGAGSALVAMACRFTSGEKYAAVEAAMARRVDALESLRGRGLELVDRDARAYDAVTAAYKLPKASDAEKAARAQAVQAALRVALEVPFDTLEQAAAGLRLAAEAVADVNPNLLSDAASGAQCLAAACESALLNVRINAGSIADRAWAAERLRRGEALRDEARALAAAVLRTAEQRLSA
jgi:formiminotetrahydrofolate cyclodeaminase